MASNSFATILHKLTLILVYAVLEWILILLLLFNSLFTYFITKFANYFGLKPPCLLCSRLDHVLEPGNNTDIVSCRDLICETHAAEISNLGYCSNHRRLAETKSMCSGCLASRPNHHSDDESVAVTRRIAFLSWICSSGDMLESGDRTLNCSCCSESLNNNHCPPYFLFKPSWKTLKYNQKGNLVIETVDDDDDDDDVDDKVNDGQYKLISKVDFLEHYNVDSSEIERNDGEELHMLSDIGSFGLKDSMEEECSGSELNLLCDEKEGNEDQKADCTCIAERDCYGMNSDHRSSDEDSLLEIINLEFKRNLEYEFNRIVPVELIDSSTFANLGSFNSKEEDQGKLDDHQDEIFDSHFKIETQVKVLEKEEYTSSAINIDDEEKFQVWNVEEMVEDLISEACEHVLSLQAAHSSSTALKNVEVADSKETDELEVNEEEVNDFKLLVDGTASQPHEQELTPSRQCLQEGNSVTYANDAETPHPHETCLARDELGFHLPGSKFSSTEEKINSDDTKQEVFSTHSEFNEVEEEKFPETPTSVDNFNYLHKKLLLFEKKESGTEESLDGSVISEADGGDPIQTVEKLKTALKAERRALNALYSELEEERSASAIAANQTMAMINRLQEEKAAMQMEALQYQRMMEEQSEYDQEALQLLNELMMKKEREKQELEKELDVYRKKAVEYESKEKVRMLRRSKDGSSRSRNSSATCSNVEDVEELSVDLNREAREGDGSIYGYQDSSSNINTNGEEINLEEIALDCVKQISSLDDSLAEFEEERLSILDQLKALEERIIALHENEVMEDGNSMGSCSKYSEKACEESCRLSTPEENDISNGLSKDTYFTERKTMGSMAKSLLPLLDAAEDETEGGLIFEENAASEFIEMENPSVPNFVLDSKKLALEEEVDHVYERLHALEADREFLKHCMSSIKKGDKGVDLLKEILQHLRDLRAVELRSTTTNINDPLGVKLRLNNQDTEDERSFSHG